ncbi:hypothetical protein SELMODRAFT_411604 [Selaginella moellendorffii]|uniref:Uncharacterized protein n=1 Tax=Selaginella moellendorffii TaxID=88036 RepID=D8RIG7_SELML|nr:hypothetical protein SELMODRAFT_411604 [Selaginella moellendorffii]
MAMAMAMGAGGSRAPEIRSEKRRKKKLGNQKLMEVFGEVTTWKEICDLNCRSRTARFCQQACASQPSRMNNASSPSFEATEHARFVHREIHTSPRGIWCKGTELINKDEIPTAGEKGQRSNTRRCSRVVTEKRSFVRLELKKRHPDLSQEAPQESPIFLYGVVSQFLVHPANFLRISRRGKLTNLGFRLSVQLHHLARFSCALSRIFACECGDHTGERVVWENDFYPRLLEQNTRVR